MDFLASCAGAAPKTGAQEAVCAVAVSAPDGKEHVAAVAVARSIVVRGRVAPHAQLLIAARTEARVPWLPAERLRDAYAFSLVDAEVLGGGPASGGVLANIIGVLPTTMPSVRYVMRIERLDEACTPHDDGVVWRLVSIEEATLELGQSLSHSVSDVVRRPDL